MKIILISLTDYEGDDFRAYIVKVTKSWYKKVSG